jgi:hypothetical protein
MQNYLTSSLRGSEAAEAIHLFTTRNISAFPGTSQHRNRPIVQQQNPLRGRTTRGLDRRSPQRTSDVGLDEEAARFQPNQETLSFQSYEIIFADFREFGNSSVSAR